MPLLPNADELLPAVRGAQRLPIKPQRINCLRLHAELRSSDGTGRAAFPPAPSTTYHLHLPPYTDASAPRLGRRLASGTRQARRGFSMQRYMPRLWTVDVARLLTFSRQADCSVAGSHASGRRRIARPGADSYHSSASSRDGTASGLAHASWPWQNRQNNTASPSSYNGDGRMNAVTLSILSAWALGDNWRSKRAG